MAKRNGWLTGDSLAGTTSRVLNIPGDINFVMAVTGALEPLSQEIYWEKFGTVEPEDAAYAMRLMLLNYLEQAPVPDSPYNSQLTLWHCFATSYIGTPLQRNTDTLQMFNQVCQQNPAALGDSRYQEALLQPGQYSATLLCIKNGGAGVIYVFASNEETLYKADIWLPLDMYSAATTRNFMTTTTFTLTQPVHRIYFQVVGKSVLSSGYLAPITCLNIVRSDIP